MDIIKCFSIFIQIYRHGMRSPIRTYKNDPFNSTRYWGVDDYGELTNDLRVISSDKDRCLMSAAATLAGLYPPEGEQIWNQDLLWRPIPIRLVPDHEDAFLKQKKHCPKYERLYHEELRTDYFQKVLKDNMEFFKYISEKSGENISNLGQLKAFFEILHTQSYFNVTLPDWIKDAFGKLECPLIDQVISHFENIIRKENALKFLMYSAHDSTLVNIMNSIEVYDYKWPKFAAILIFELRKDDERHFVNILYKNADDLAKLSLKGCQFDCDIHKFKQTLAPVRINLKDWRRACFE
ncbi:hypothetical protein NQ314_014699 [Rhamnusium bicolor]|uniref:acid phosphatase n=1 Tax=Rhamnusium bicolor TaxID=1586634 RepID=A0AAV8X0Z8_9CUCU|nr:hypothetical protein NQ314_014699 [Rhamnusium bicolor]